LACRPRSQVVGSPSANRHQFGRDGVRVEADVARIGQRLVGKRQRWWPICVPPNRWYGIPRARPVSAHPARSTWIHKQRYSAEYAWVGGRVRLVVSDRFDPSRSALIA
jgi:hypothetical protein